MDHRETAGNHRETSSDDAIVKRLDILDDKLLDLLQRVTAVQQFIEEHRPALARGLALMDPGAKVREALGMKKKNRAVP